MFNKKKVALHKDYHEVFKSEKGKRVLHDLMETSHVLSSSFDPNPYEMARMEGERNVVLRILQILKVSPLQYENMIREYEESEALKGDRYED